MYISEQPLNRDQRRLRLATQLEAAMRKIMASPDFRQRLESQGFVVPPAGSAHYSSYMNQQVTLGSRVIKTAGIKPE